MSQRRDLALEIRHLRMIQALAEEGSFTRAAERLCLTPSALSHQLRSIESRLEVRLFNRSAKSLNATAEGERLIEVASQTIDMLSAAEADVVRLSKGLFGALRLSTACYTCYHWLPQMVSAFRQLHPDVDLELVLEATRHPLPAVIEGRLDLAITDEEIVDDRLLQRELFVDEIVALVPPNHPLASREYLLLADFTEQHLIVHNKSQNSFVNRVLRQAGIVPRKVSDVQMTDGICELAKAGVGIAVMARWAASRDLRDQTLVALPIGEEGIRRRWRAAFSKERRHPAFLWDFLDLLCTSAFDERGLISECEDMIGQGQATDCPGTDAGVCSAG